MYIHLAHKPLSSFSSPASFLPFISTAMILWRHQFAPHDSRFEAAAAGTSNIPHDPPALHQAGPGRPSLHPLDFSLSQMAPK